MYAWNAPNICIIHSSCGPVARKESWPTCMKEVKRWSFFCRDLMSSRAKGWLLQKVPTACLIFSSSPPLNYKTASQRICGWVVESLITQRRPTTTATGYKQNTRPYPRQHLISYAVDDRQLVLLSYRGHLICYPHWNLKDQMPWWDNMWQFIWRKCILEENILCNWMISSRLVNMFLMSAEGSMFSRVSFW